jgi:hypothetical protein
MYHCLNLCTGVLINPATHRTTYLCSTVLAPDVFEGIVFYHDFVVVSAGINCTLITNASTPGDVGYEQRMITFPDAFDTG